MRIFNGTDSTLTLPLTRTERLTIAPKSPSGNIMGNTEFLSLLVTSFHPDEIAVIVSGPYELNSCANIPTMVNYVVESLDEAVLRFTKKEVTVEDVVEETCSCDTCNTTEEATPINEEETEVVEDSVEEVQDKKSTSKKATSKK